VAELDLAHDRCIELRGRAWHVWLRRGVLPAFAAFCVLGLVGVFGQHSTTAAVTAPRASLRVDAPSRLRGSLLYQARFVIRAGPRRLSQPKLILGENWFDNVTLNSTTPDPSAENSRGGRFSMAFPPIEARHALTVLSEWQVNPTAKLGRRSLSAAVADGNTRLARLQRTLTILP